MALFGSNKTVDIVPEYDADYYKELYSSFLKDLLENGQGPVKREFNPIQNAFTKRRASHPSDSADQPMGKRGFNPMLAMVSNIRNKKYNIFNFWKEMGQAVSRGLRVS